MATLTNLERRDCNIKLGNTYDSLHFYPQPRHFFPHSPTLFANALLAGATNNLIGQRPVDKVKNGNQPHYKNNNIVRVAKTDSNLYIK